MKIIQWVIVSFLFILFSCEDDTINMLTQINPDGSCVREFTQNTKPEFIVGDTAENNPFPFHIDSLWNVEIIWDTESGKVIHEWPFTDWAKDTIGKKEDIRARATRHFPNVENLNNYNFFERSDWKSFYPEISFEKKFRWFYTYYHFQERYLRYKPFNIIPITEYLKKEEIKMWFQGDDEYFNGLNGIEINERLSDIEKKYERWLERNYFEEQYQVILNNLYLINDLNVDQNKIFEKKDLIFKKYKKLEGDFPELLLIMDTTFHTNIFSEILGKNEKIEKEMDDLFGFIDLYTTSINYKLLVPGKITHTNSVDIKSDTLFWKIDAYRFTENDYEIYAKSRKANAWAFVLSGVFILVVGLSYFVSFKKK